MRNALRSLFDMYETPGQIALALGLVGLTASAVMAFFFGKEISWTHGVFLVVVAICAAVGPHLAHNVWHVSRIAGSVVAICCIPLLAIEFYTHMGYTAGLRGVNIGDAKVQQARYTGAQEAVSEDKTNLTMWTERLQKLEGEYAWLPTVTSESLQARLASANLSIEQESKRGGCGPKCLERTKERDEIASRMNLARERADLTKKIEATKAVLAKARDKADTTEFKHSAADHQAAALVKLVSMVYSGTLKASDMQSEAVEQSVNTGMAVAATGLPALFLFIASFFLIRRLAHSQPQGRPEAMPAPTHHDAAHKAPIAPSILQIGSRTLKEWAEDVASGRVATAGAR